MILKGDSPAIHKLGDIRRSHDDLIRIDSEDENNYIGCFEEGFGFIGVKFNKNDCRLLTQEEREKLNGSWYGINGNPMYRIYVDEEGNVINGKTITVKGVITRITDNKSNDKHTNFVGLEVEFGEDILVGRSMIILTERGSITTSKVTNVNIVDNKYIINTSNSVYYIDVK